MRVVSVLALVGAVFGAFVGYLTYEVMCFNEIGGSTMCPRGHPTTTMTAQLVVGLGGIVPAVLMVFFAFRGAKRAAASALVMGLVLWAAWAFLNDAAVHQWGSDMRLIP